MQLQYQDLAKNVGVYADSVYIYDNNTLNDFDSNAKLSFQEATSV